MNKQINARIQHKRDQESNWTSNNPVLLDGELGFVDTSDGALQFKIGDGSTAYTSLSHFNFVPGATTDDNNKILTVVDGAPAWTTPTQLQLEVITQDEYDALTTKDSNTLYIIEV